jgi:DNA excision repair protein ERCC-1
MNHGDNNPKTSAPSKPTIVNSYAKKKAVKQSTNSNLQLEPIPKAKTILPVDPSSTFSQAFKDYDPDAKFAEKDRSEQAKFEEALVAANTNINNKETIPELTNRDHHAFLAPHVLHVSTTQRGNPILNYVRNVPYKESKMVPDYIFSSTRCALFLSIKYHKLHPRYIHKRIAELGKDFDLRVLLCQVDLDDNANIILSLNKLCVENNLTLILAWSEEEAARYLETFKAFDGKDASLIQKREHTNYPDQIAHVLGSVRSVNKTDASQLLSQFGTWKDLVGASVEELSVCPGVGVKKVRRLCEAFHRPFSKEGAKRRKAKEEAEKAEIAKREESKQDSVDNEDYKNDKSVQLKSPSSAAESSTERC